MPSLSQHHGINRHPRMIALIVLIGGLAFVACADTKRVTISGSSTVEPITSANAEKFSQHESIAITVDGPGTGDGFELFCRGETDISDASRSIKDEEKALCDKNGVDYVELKVANDGLSVITSPKNTGIGCLAFGDLYALLGPESNGFANWSDADRLANEVGGQFAPYPDKRLVVTAPGEESGTYDSFVEIVIKPIAEKRHKEPEIRKDYTSSPNDNVILEGIAGSKGSLGWTGYAFAAENKNAIKMIEIDGGSGCIAPTDATIADGSYPISRPLYIYVNKKQATENSGVADFVDFYLSRDGIESVSEVGYVPLPNTQYEEVRKTWEASKS